MTIKTVKSENLLKKFTNKNSLKFAVIGSGPIGLATAIQLAEKGHNVKVFEASDQPKDHSCGETIMPSGKDILNTMSLENHLDPHFSKELKTIKYFDDNIVLKGQLPRNAKAIKRTELIKALLSKCKELNITLHKHHRVIEIERIKEKYQPIFLQTEKKKEKSNFNFDYIVATDGDQQNLRKMLKLDKVKTAKPSRLGARFHIHFEHSLNEIQIFWKDGIKASLTPTGENILEIAFLWDTEKINLKGNLKNQLFQLFPELEGYKECPQLSTFKEWGPLNDLQQLSYQKNIIILEDSRIFLNGIAGDGLTFGLKQGQALTRSFPGGVWSPTIYNLHMTPIIFHNRAINKSSTFLNNNPEIRKNLFKVANKIPPIFNSLLVMSDFQGILPQKNTSSVKSLEDLSSKYSFEKIKKQFKKAI